MNCRQSGVANVEALQRSRPASLRAGRIMPSCQLLKDRLCCLKLPIQRAPRHNPVLGIRPVNGVTVFGIWMSDGNQLPPAGETACPTYFAKRLIQQGGAGGFACRSNGHNQWSASSASNDEQIPENG